MEREQKIHFLFNLLQDSLQEYESNVADELEGDGQDSAAVGVAMNHISRDVGKLHEDFTTIETHLNSRE